MYYVIFGGLDDDDDEEDEEEEDEDDEGAEKGSAFSIYSHTPDDLFLDSSSTPTHSHILSTHPHPPFQPITHPLTHQLVIITFCCTRSHL